MSVWLVREPMHLCTYVSEEGDDGEAPCSETPFGRRGSSVLGNAIRMYRSRFLERREEKKERKKESWKCRTWNRENVDAELIEKHL